MTPVRLYRNTHFARLLSTRRDDRSTRALSDSSDSDPTRDSYSTYHNNGINIHREYFNIVHGDTTRPTSTNTPTHRNTTPTTITMQSMTNHVIHQQLVAHDEGKFRLEPLGSGLSFQLPPVAQKHPELVLHREQVFSM